MFTAGLGKSRIGQGRAGDRAGDRARWTGKGKAGHSHLQLTWIVVDLNIMSCPRVPTLGMYSRMILHPHSCMSSTYHNRPELHTQSAFVSGTAHQLQLG